MIMKLTDKHQDNLLQISKRMHDYYNKNRRIRIYRGASNSTRVLSFKKDAIIDISHLDQVLAVNKKEACAIVEPNVPMDKLVDETLKYGLIPPVVMEFPGITVGGGIQGGSGESSSFRWGTFDEICLEYEVVLGNGKIVKASKKENADLFYGLASSYGSIGIITGITMKLIPAKKFVKLTYLRVDGPKKIVEAISSQTKKKIEYIDAILFSKNCGAVMTGVLTDEADLRVTTFSRAIDEWFYLHAKNVVKKYQKWEEIVPIKEYFFRYDRGAFWAGKAIFQTARFPFNRLTRAMLNPIFKTRSLYRLLQALKTPQQAITQDLILPERSVEKFLNFVDLKTKFYPIWLCPLKSTVNEFMSPTFLKGNLVMDVGVWQRPKWSVENLISFNREIEKQIRKLGGRKVLYAHCYYHKKNFWSIYDFGKYNKLREKYFAKKTLPNIFEKVIVKERYKTSYLGGLISLIKSPANFPVD